MKNFKIKVHNHEVISYFVRAEDEDEARTLIENSEDEDDRRYNSYDYYIFESGSEWFIEDIKEVGS